MLRRQFLFGAVPLLARSLFDGRSTQGWVSVTREPFPDWCWCIEDGCIKSTPGRDAFQDIRTVGEYADFDFSFEWRLARGGNSGVKYRLEKIDRWKSREGSGFHARARGYEFQLLDPDATDAVRRDGRYTTGALYGVRAAEGVRCRTAGEFNQGRLVVRGTRSEHWVNGVRVLEFDGLRPGPSPIALQHHSSEVWFRDLRISL